MSGTGSGSHQLTAFDAALGNAGISDFNLIKVTSIIPPGIKVCSLAPGACVRGNGLMVPTIYEYASTAVEGQTVAAAIGIGLARDLGQPGLGFTHSGPMDAKAATEIVTDMVREGMAARDRGADYEVVVGTPQCTGSKGWSASVAALLYTDAQTVRLIESCR